MSDVGMLSGTTLRIDTDCCRKKENPHVGGRHGGAPASSVGETSEYGDSERSMSSVKSNIRMVIEKSYMKELELVIQGYKLQDEDIDDIVKNSTLQNDFTETYSGSFDPDSFATISHETEYTFYSEHERKSRSKRPVEVVMKRSESRRSMNTRGLCRGQPMGDFLVLTKRASKRSASDDSQLSLTADTSCGVLSPGLVPRLLNCRKSESKYKMLLEILGIRQSDSNKDSGIGS